MREEPAAGRASGEADGPDPARSRGVASSPPHPFTRSPLLLLRRFLLLQALLVWQGGFLFYTSFVVPAGTAVLGSAAAQGIVTTRVTDALNVLGAVGLALAAWDLNYARDPGRRRTAARWWCWAVALLCQGLLFYLHLLMDAFMDPDRTRVVIRPLFYPVHRAYLWASTVQWLVCLVFGALTLAAWRAEDRGGEPGPA